MLPQILWAIEHLLYNSLYPLNRYTRLINQTKQVVWFPEKDR